MKYYYNHYQRRIEEMTDEQAAAKVESLKSIRMNDGNHLPQETPEEACKSALKRFLSQKRWAREKMSEAADQLEQWTHTEAQCEMVMQSIPKPQNP